MERTNFLYESPKVELMELEIEQAMLQGSGNENWEVTEGIG